MIGSSCQADLVVKDPTVSRFHCALLSVPEGILVRDLGSTNGTRVAGMLVGEAILPQRTHIALGGSEILFARSGGQGPVRDSAKTAAGPFDKLLGDSPVMQELITQLSRAAACDVTLLLEGECGTGKELAAQAVHAASPRRGGPFITIDPRSRPRRLLEVDLLGYERGAFAGARHACDGAFVRAHGGTLFLDGINDLEPDIQPRLLSIIDRHEVTPIGARSPRPIDVRIVAATNRDLRREVARGTFREELFYRLAVACVRLPPLRERRADIALLCRQFLAELSERDGGSSTLDERTLSDFRERAWPGNVRELRNALEHFVSLGSPNAPLVSCAPEAPPPFKEAKARLIDRFEKEYLVSLLNTHNGNITASARAAQVDRVHFLRLLDRHELRG